MHRNEVHGLNNCSQTLYGTKNMEGETCNSQDDQIFETIIITIIK